MNHHLPVIEASQAESVGLCVPASETLRPRTRTGTPASASSELFPHARGRPLPEFISRCRRPTSPLAIETEEILEASSFGVSEFKVESVTFKRTPRERLLRDAMRVVRGPRLLTVGLSDENRTEDRTDGWTEPTRPDPNLRRVVEHRCSRGWWSCLWAGRQVSNYGWIACLVIDLRRSTRYAVIFFLIWLGFNNSREQTLIERQRRTLEKQACDHGHRRGADKGMTSEVLQGTPRHKQGGRQ